MIVGLTGGIGAGKSAVADRLAAHGAVVVDADRLAREVVEPGTPGLASVRSRFGPAVVREDGCLDREALGRLIFADPEARRDLEAIIHPLVLARTRELTSLAKPGATVVHDVPLLVEAGLRREYDLVIVVLASERTRMSRLTLGRGLSEEDAVARIRAQATDAERRAVADVIIENDGSYDALMARTDEVWEDLVSRQARA